MGMAVDQAGHDERSPGIDDAAPRKFRRDIFGMSHCRDIRTFNGHSTIGDDRIFIIHDQDDSTGNNEIHLSHLTPCPLIRIDAKFLSQSPAFLQEIFLQDEMTLKKSLTALYDRLCGRLK